MSKRGDKPRRLMTKVRRQVGKPTMTEIPKNIYDRNEWKRETEKLIEAVCTCAGGNCMCDEDYICDKCSMREEDDKH